MLRDPSLPPRRRRPEQVAARAQLQRAHATVQQVASDVATIEAGTVSTGELTNADLPTDNTALALALAQINTRLEALEPPP
jgi:hypothetical protein